MCGKNDQKNSSLMESSFYFMSSEVPPSEISQKSYKLPILF